MENVYNSAWHQVGTRGRCDLDHVLSPEVKLISLGMWAPLVPGSPAGASCTHLPRSPAWDVVSTTPVALVSVTPSAFLGCFSFLVAV